MFMKIFHKIIGPEAAAEEWKRLCALGKKVAVAEAAIGHNQLVFEGRCIVDTGSGDHVCGPSMLSKSQQFMKQIN